jgi:L-aminopeptidase/D-esterase-like protein
MFDGDTVFTVATSQVNVEMENRSTLVNTLGVVAADVLSRAIIHGVLHAESINDYECHRDKFPEAYNLS